ncbi:MFS transporter [Clostridium sp.]|uniref:MFS transporter n=1 Tax=Clostridium sp. TaxID=1506 RepID=UPI001D5C3466|nr:MFS transporter [Clostridium sp.]MBS5937949.1 MFS transporter [Clostridium sp.]
MFHKNVKVHNPDKLGFGKLLAYKSSDVTAAGISAIVISFLSLYCTDALGMNPMIVGSLLMASKIFDAFTDIIAGWLVDNTHTKLGKGRPYELCIIGVTVCTLGLFSANPQWSNFMKCAWIFCMYTLVFSVFTTLRSAANIPYTIRAFSNNQAVITKVASYGGIITMAGSIGISVVFPIVMSKLATDAAGWTKTVAIFVLPLTIIGVMRFIFIKEDPSVDAGSQHKKISIKEIFKMMSINNYIWIFASIMLCYNISTSLGMASYYFKWIIGNTALISVTSIVSVVLLPLMFTFPALMRKIGSMGKMISSFCIIGILGYVIVFFSGSNVIGVLTGSAIGAFATLPLAYYGVLFVMKCCTYNEMKGLPRMDGSVGILSNFATKFGSAIGSAIAGILLGLAGYVSGENVISQPQSAIMMIRILYSVVPAMFLVIIFVACNSFAKLEKKIEVWEEEKKALNEEKVNL